MKRHHDQTPSEIRATNVKVESEPNRAGHLKDRLSRRSVLKSLTATATLAAIPSTVVGLVGQTPAESGKHQHAPKPPMKPQNPPWYGFNLLEYFSTDPDWMKYFPYKNDGMFAEDDFRWMRDWGFNFARLPMDYRFWTDPNNLMTINPKKVEPIDRAIRLGEKYGVHVNIGLHRAPGFCILDDVDAALTGIHVTPEKASYYNDAHAVDAFAHQWTYFAGRYKSIPSERLSFNLVNEPVYRPAPAERAELVAHLKDQSPAAVDREISALGEKKYARVARRAINAIRSVDPHRLIVTDGWEAGSAPVPDLIDTGVLQSPHDYYPAQLTHYKTEWAPWVKQTEPPTWPIKDKQGKVVADRRAVEDLLRPWRGMLEKGVCIHFGETGCNRRTPHAVMLAWLSDTLDVIGELHSGWALWNFRGVAGVLDTNRADAKFEDWHGHKLDRELLQLLQKR